MIDIITDLRIMKISPNEIHTNAALIHNAKCR